MTEPPACVQRVPRACRPMPPEVPALRSAIAALPLSDSAVQAACAIDPGPWPVPTDVVLRWGGDASPFRWRSQATWLLAPGRGAMLASVHPEAVGGALGMFGWLRLHPSLSGAERVALTKALIHEARAFTRSHGASRLRGPMTFSTWLPYRVLAEDSPPDELAFPGEGAEPQALNALYLGAGLRVCDRYVTRAVPEDPAHWEAALAREALIAARRGDRLQVREVKPGEAEALLPHIHGWLNASFARTPYFTPVGPQELAEHLVARGPTGVVPAQLVAADARGTPHGVLTGFLHEGGGVLKTVAVSPAAQGGRAAMALTFGFHRWLHARGTTRAWHAQMREEAISARMSAKHARAVRCYVLYGDADD
ncbi:MAG: hypothetical protein VKQ33_09405 [Candidatus Sericytochromatia bacterium]|nr:hypothetical protein [Candidatus Sericytochromatia bacterium]